MISPKTLEKLKTVPFLLHYGQPINPTTMHEHRYDLDRQIIQIKIAGIWQDAEEEAKSESVAQTLITCVARETTDDN
jgi:hypothetical protein